MNRVKNPCCSKCKNCYQLPDANRVFRVPILLNCGHDMCKLCLKYMFKVKEPIICKVCQVHIIIENENDLHNLQIHFYIIGKLWYLNSLKKYELNSNISKLEMTKTPSMFLELNKNICFKCKNKANGFCQDCKMQFCGNCFDEVHIENEIFAQHKLTIINDTSSSFPQKLKCDKHLKTLDFVCIPCNIQICLNCATIDHQTQRSTDPIHSVVTLNKYSSYQIPRLQELATKGNNMVQSLSSSRDALHKEMLEYQNKLKKKDGDLNDIKQEVADFMNSVSGVLQNIEITLINLLNEAEQSILDSMINVLNNLNSFVDDLQDKITKVEQFMKYNQNSCEILLDSIFTIEKLLNTTLNVAKKNKIKPPLVTYNNEVFIAVQQCMDLKIDDYSDTYILTDLSEVPTNYTFVSPIKYMIQHERPPSSFSSYSTGSSNLSASFVDLAISKPTQKQQLDYPIKELKLNQVEGIIVTHVNSPSDFYLQLDDNCVFLNMINLEMNKSLEAEARKYGDIEMNNVFYAVNNFDNIWYRGVVVNMKMEHDEMLYTVHYIDYGFIEIVTVDRIYRLSENIVSIPPLAFNCALYGLKPSTTTGWSEAAIHDFNCLILEKRGVYFVYPVSMLGELFEVDVVWSNDIHPLSTRDAMLFMNHGTTDVPTNKELHDKLLKIITLPRPEKLQKNVSYPINATHFISPSEFYFRIRNDIVDNKFKNMMESLQLKYKPTEVDTHRAYLLYSPKIGMAVAARYSSDDEWYRAKIISIPEPRMVTVFYVDYGNSETLPWHQLRALDRGFIYAFKPLAIKACLADIKPAIKGLETTKWTKDALKAFVDMLQDHNNVKNTTACVQRTDSDDDDDDNDDNHNGDNIIHYVVVYNRWSREEFCVNRLLVNQGYASAENLESCIFQKPNKRKPSKQLNTASVKTNVRNNVTVVLTSDDLIAFTKQRPDIVSENHTWSTTNKKFKDVPGVEMLIHKVNSPDDIVLKYMDLNIVSLTERMNKIYEKSKKNFIKTDWKAKDLCAMFIKKYGNWYRGKILEVDTTKKTASVLFYDLDEIHNEVFLKVLYSLDSKVVHEKCCFLHCCLFNIVPTGTKDGSEWSSYACDRLIEKLANYRVVYFLKQGKKGDRAAGQIWVKNNKKPQALEPAQNNWTNINQFLIVEGYALSDRQYGKESSEYSTSPSDYELNKSFENPTTMECWLPPEPLDPDTNVLNVIPLYVDMQCNVYFRTLDDETKQLLQEVTENLQHEFCNSKPEPLNIKWTLGQIVIVQYHLDKQWYRGTIIEVKENNEFEVQFLDYGNIETCTHSDLRSTLYMTDVRQLCVKGFLSTISPLDEKWSEGDMDFLHTLIVEKPCKVTIDFNKSTDNNYAITRIRNTAAGNQLESDVCQLMVTMKKAYFSYMNLFELDMTKKIDVPKIDNSLSLNYQTTIIEPSYEDSSCFSPADAGAGVLTDYGNYLESESYSDVEDYDVTEMSLDVSTESATNMEDYYLGKNSIQIEEIINDISEERILCSKQSNDSAETEYEDCEILESRSNGSRGKHVDVEELDDNNYRYQTASIHNINDYNGLMNYDGQSIENLVLDNINCNDKESSKLSDTPSKITHIGASKLAVIDKTSTAQSTTHEKINDIVDTKQISCSVPSTDNVNDTKSEHNNEKRNLTIAKSLKKIHTVPGDSKDENVAYINVSYPKMSLKYSDAIEACLCEIKAPTSVTLIIEKIGGVDMTDRKIEMNKQLMDMMKHACMPEVDKIIPGTPVVVQHNYLWKRGIVVDDGLSVYLVDYGTSIDLVEKNLRQCPLEFIEQPMFSIDCQLAHVTKNCDVSSEVVMRKLKDLLNGAFLRVVGVNELDGDVVEVELFNNKKEIAYQSLIDSGVLISR